MKLTRLAFLSIAAFLVGTNGGFAAETRETRTITLEDCIEMALEKNLDIRVERLTPEIARATLSGSYGAYEPTFDLFASHSSVSQPGGFTSENLPFPPGETVRNVFSTGVGGLLPTGARYSVDFPLSDTYGSQAGFPFEDASARIGFSVTQPLLRNFWIDSARLNILLNRKNLSISELTLRNQIIATISAVEIAYYELIAARETIKVAEMALQLAEQLLRENRKRVEVGVLAPLDEKEAESQVAASRADLLGAENSLVIQQNNLKALLNDGFAAWHTVDLVPTEKLTSPPQTFSLQDSWSKGLTYRPDLQQAKLDLERRHITLRYQRNQLFPQLDIQGSYGQSGRGDEFSDAVLVARRGDNPDYSFGAVFSIPLGGNRQARSQVRIAKAEIQQALLRLQRLEQDIMVQIDNAIAQARSSYQRVQATEEAAEFAEQALRAEEKKLENGKSTSFQVLQLQRILTQRAFERIRARVDYNVALARLAQAEASTLERHRIKLDVK